MSFGIFLVHSIMLILMSVLSTDFFAKAHLHQPTHVHTVLYSLPILLVAVSHPQENPKPCLAMVLHPKQNPKASLVMVLHPHQNLKGSLKAI